ncbi:MAG: PQQ-binding-like beta-propeller repeat protein [Opitutaceae bacterium]|nr:PQQ-binding-like beta-propeller repeat protein [Opitutaceae bacterium]
MNPDIFPSKSLCVLSLALAAVAWNPVRGSAAKPEDWPSYLGSQGTHYSSLSSINRGNVAKLKPAWIFRAGDAGKNTQIQCNPLILDGVLYGTTPQLSLFALDAGTGRELWRFDPFAHGSDSTARQGVNRGLAFWKEGNEQRIFYTAGSNICAIDPKTGRLIESFGRGGRVDLFEGLGVDVRGLYLVGTSPGAVYRDVFIVSTRVGEGPGPAAPGHIRAYDVRTGKLRWIFRTIPHPGEFGHDTWPEDAWKKIGGANNWAGLAIDEKRGLAFVPTGSAAFDFWGGNRLGSNLFADCLLALDALTGERRWHFQFTHHDVWDRDPPAAPVLCQVRRGGRLVDAVVQVTKSGHVWAFDRDTGESLFPWEERPVPQTKLTGEATWPTQPVPLMPAPFARQQFTEDEVTNRTPAVHAAVLQRLRELDPHVPFTPPSERGTIVLPGFDGGAEWGGPAVDPEGVLYVNSNEMAWIHQMIPARPGGSDGGKLLYTQLCMSCHGPGREGNPAGNIPSLVGLAGRSDRGAIATILRDGKGMMPAFRFLRATQRDVLVDYLFDVPHAPVAEARNEAGSKQEPTGEEMVLPEIPYTTTGYNRFFDADGYPAIKPPWGTLNAIDLNTGEYLWRRPLGELPELTAAGIPPTGAENYGGPLVTAGDVIFIAASKDEKFRAFDRRTGDLLWETSLPAGGYATPATYAVGGRQYVVIAAGGGKMGTKSGDAYIAFALPE